MRDTSHSVYCRLANFGVVTSLLVLSGVAEARPYKPGEVTDLKVLNQLGRRVGIQTPPVEDFCRVPAETPCADASLSRFKGALSRLGGGGAEKVKVLQLGDSHIASDFISSYTRHELQAAFGNGGRGLVHADQRWGYGGRKVGRPERAWSRTRVVDANGPGRAYGLFGIALEARGMKAYVDYRVLPEDAQITIHYKTGPNVPGFVLLQGGKPIAKLTGRSKTSQTAVKTVELKPSDRPQKLRLKALGRGATVYGLSFETNREGVVWSSIGPVGADARVYLQLEQKSFFASLQAHRPQLIVLMVGGNDALKVRKQWKTLDTVVEDHRLLIKALRDALPEVDILVMSPMDAGVLKGGKVFSKPFLVEMQSAQKEVALELGTGYWDTFSAMGGKGSIQKWVSAGVMSKDLVHPRKKAADLLGKTFADALMRWYKL